MCESFFQPQSRFSLRFRPTNITFFIGDWNLPIYCFKFAFAVRLHHQKFSNLNPSQFSIICKFINKLCYIVTSVWWIWISMIIVKYVIHRGEGGNLALQLPVLHWMIKGNTLSTHHTTNATWSKWVALISQRSLLRKPNCPGILEEIMDWPKAGILEHRLRRWFVPKIHHHIMHYQKMQEAMGYLLMDPAVVGKH